MVITRTLLSDSSLHHYLTSTSASTLSLVFSFGASLGSVSDAFCASVLRGCFFNFFLGFVEYGRQGSYDVTIFHYRGLFHEPDGGVAIPLVGQIIVRFSNYNCFALWMRILLRYVDGFAIEFGFEVVFRHCIRFS